MDEKLELVKFNLTPIMAEELIKFNDLKKELNKLKNKENLTQEDLKNIKALEENLNKTRIRFIKNFRESNKEEIDIYLKMKDQF